MLDNILSDDKLAQYKVSFEDGQTLFLEGDTSQDLYVLLSGSLEVIKGDKRLTEISDPGSFCGEISFLLGSRRTSTVKAFGEVSAFRFPRNEIATIMDSYPVLGREMTIMLARRLEQTSQELYGFKEFTDQMPDPVIMLDKEGKMVSWNYAAEELYGRDWNDMRMRSIEEIFAQKSDFDDFFNEIRQGGAYREHHIKINLPDERECYVAVSTKNLYDGHHNFKGVLCLGRDVTNVKKMEERYLRIKKCLLPCALVFVLMAATLFYGYTSFIKSSPAVTVEATGLRNQLAKDYLVLMSLFTKDVFSQTPDTAIATMKNFFTIQATESLSYTGLVLLDDHKRVFAAYSIIMEDQGSRIVGTSYGGIEFKGSEQSLHKVLTLYRANKAQPMGQKGLEIAFEISNDNGDSCWLLFQMDVVNLKQVYGIDEEALLAFHFEKS